MADEEKNETTEVETPDVVEEPVADEAEPESESRY